MFSFEQIATRTEDIEASISLLTGVGHLPWIRDEVRAIHLYGDPALGLGDEFQVRLAFNYELFEGKEFELIQLVSGCTAQLPPAGPASPISHFGYHIPDPPYGDEWVDALPGELRRLQSLGMKIVQVSQTVEHSNTRKRYRYAFALLPSLGAPVKIIQRLPSVISISEGKDTYAWLAK